VGQFLLKIGSAAAFCHVVRLYFEAMQLGLSPANTTVRFLRFRNTLCHRRDVLRWHKNTNFPHILIHKLWSVLNNNTMHLPNNRNSQYQCTNPISPAWGIHNTATLEIHVARQCCSTRFRGVTRHARQPISSGPLHRSRSQIGFVGGIVVAL